MRTAAGTDIDAMAATRGIDFWCRRCCDYASERAGGEPTPTPWQVSSPTAPRVLVVSVPRGCLAQPTMSETDTTSDRDWRKSAYLKKDNWPEAIPWTGPKREYGPYPWPPKTHPALDDRDQYPHQHIDAASVGEKYLGDVCPYCGVPIRRDETVVLEDGTEGTFWDINETENLVPAWHSDCWSERLAEGNHAITEWSG